MNGGWLGDVGGANTNRSVHSPRGGPVETASPAFRGFGGGKGIAPGTPGRLEIRFPHSRLRIQLT
jgi:hypothetical protein